MTEAEKEAFKLAATNSDQDLSVWIRVQLHRAATQDLAGHETNREHHDEIETGQTRHNRASSMR